MERTGLDTPDPPCPAKVARRRSPSHSGSPAKRLEPRARSTVENPDRASCRAHCSTAIARKACCRGFGSCGRGYDHGVPAHRPRSSERPGELCAGHALMWDSRMADDERRGRGLIGCSVPYRALLRLHRAAECGASRFAKAPPYATSTVSPSLDVYMAPRFVQARTFVNCTAPPSIPQRASTHRARGVQR